MNSTIESVHTVFLVKGACGLIWVDVVGVGLNWLDFAPNRLRNRLLSKLLQELKGLERR